MGAFLLRIFGGAVAGKAIAWIAAAGIAAAIAAAVVSYGSIIKHKTLAEVKETISDTQQVRREINHKVDRTTIDRDAAVTLQLQENDRKWTGSKQLP